MFVIFAHRGVSEYTPQNTLFEFNLGIYIGASDIKSDVQLTKDSILVLFHYNILLRMTGQEGSVSYYTYDELRQFNVIKNEYFDKILKFEDFIRYFYFRDITFAIGLKNGGSKANS